MHDARCVAMVFATEWTDMDEHVFFADQIRMPGTGRIWGRTAFVFITCYGWVRTVAMPDSVLVTQKLFQSQHHTFVQRRRPSMSGARLTNKCLAFYRFRSRVRKGKSVGPRGRHNPANLPLMLRNE
jgi:hypothetical protein